MYMHGNPVYLSRYGIRFFQRVERGEDGEKVYDGFVVYSVEDDMYVQQVLASELELGANQFRYKI